MVLGGRRERLKTKKLNRRKDRIQRVSPKDNERQSIDIDFALPLIERTGVCKGDDVGSGEDGVEGRRTPTLTTRDPRTACTQGCEEGCDPFTSSTSTTRETRVPKPNDKESRIGSRVDLTCVRFEGRVTPNFHRFTRPPEVHK